MNIFLNNQTLSKYSRQIVLKNVGVVGQKKILNSKVLVIGAGGLGCAIIDLLTRAGIGHLGIIEHDKVQHSNLHRQTLYTSKDVNRYKTDIIKKRIKLINSKIKLEIFNEKAIDKNLNKILPKFDIIIDGSDNFPTKFLLNKYSLKYKKILIIGAISKFDGHIFCFDFSKKGIPCLNCFYQGMPSDEILNCESEGILGPTANVIGSMQANEALKFILGIKNNSKNCIVIIDLLNLTLRKVNFKKRKNCLCIKR
tara:strand:- start:121 stop:879 length:759 start_codon:yes stop_codon:yes gene_type:complete